MSVLLRAPGTRAIPLGPRDSRVSARSAPEMPSYGHTVPSVLHPESYRAAARAFSNRVSSWDASTSLPRERFIPPPKPVIWSVDVRFA